MLVYYKDCGKKTSKYFCIFGQKTLQMLLWHLQSSIFKSHNHSMVEGVILYAYTYIE